MPLITRLRPDRSCLCSSIPILHIRHDVVAKCTYFSACSRPRPIYIYRPSINIFALTIVLRLFLNKCAGIRKTRINVSTTISIPTTIWNICAANNVLIAVRAWVFISLSARRTYTAAQVKVRANQTAPRISYILKGKPKQFREQSVHQSSLWQCRSTCKYVHRHYIIIRSSDKRKQSSRADRTLYALMLLSAHLLAHLGGICG